MYNRPEDSLEKNPLKEPEKAEFVDTEEKLDQYTEERLSDVHDRATDSKRAGKEELDHVLSAYELPGEEIESIRKDIDIDKKLQDIDDEINRLASETEEEISNVTTSSEDRESSEKERVIENAQKERGDILKDTLTSDIVNNGLNLVPFAGGGKMMVESIAGKELSGHKLTGKERVIHGAVGTGSLILDFTGVGEVSKAGIIAGKSVVLIEKAGARLAAKGATKSSRVFQKTAEFMTKNPKLTSEAELYADKKIAENIVFIDKYKKDRLPETAEGVGQEKAA